MRNWKTTLAGVAAGATFLVDKDLTAWQSWLLPLVLAIFGAVSKDFNVSGRR